MLPIGSWLERQKAEEAIRHLADRLQELTGKQLPLGLALLAAVLATVLFLQAQLKGSAGGKREDGVPERRKISRDEVAKHDRPTDIWIILKNKVYDVSPYVEEHPGGKAILRHAGGDSTQGFFGPQHPDRVFDLIDDFYVGDLDDQ